MLVFSAIATVLGALWYYEPERPLMVLAAPLGIVVLGFALVLAMIPTVIGDVFAEWAIEKIVSKPDPENATHQVLVFVLSSIGFVGAAFVVGLGDMPAYR